MADANVEPDLFQAAQLLSQRADRMALLAGSVSPSLAKDMTDEIAALRLAVRELLRADATARKAQETGGDMYFQYLR